MSTTTLERLEKPKCDPMSFEGLWLVLVPFLCELEKLLSTSKSISKHKEIYVII